MADDEPTPLVKWSIVLCVAVVLALVAIGLLVSATLGRPTGPGVFGDMFGVANALFSGLAFVGLVFAILLQRQELGLQRRELEETRAEMARARAESARSALATEQAARLSALSQLIAYNKAEMEKHRRLAFVEIPDTNAPGGVYIDVIDEDSAGEFQEHSERFDSLVRELAEVYNNLHIGPRSTV